MIFLSKTEHKFDKNVTEQYNVITSSDIISLKGHFYLYVSVRPR